MAYPCTIILLNMNMDTYLTFKYFCNLILAKEFTMNIFQFKMDMIKVYTKTFEEFLKQLKLLDFCGIQTVKKASTLTT